MCVRKSGLAEPEVDVDVGNPAIWAMETFGTKECFISLGSKDEAMHAVGVSNRLFCKRA